MVIMFMHFAQHASSFSSDHQLSRQAVTMGYPIARRHTIRMEDAGIWILLFLCCFVMSNASNVSLPAGGNTVRRHPNVTLYDITVSVCDSHQTCDVLGCGVSNNTVCNCDDACVRYGDCCWDFATTCNPDNDSYELEWDMGAYRDLTTCETVPSYSGIRSVDSYFMIGRCPEDWEFAETRDLCERTSRNDSILNWLRVDNQQGVSFKNIYCAFCNGVEPYDIISWKILANCLSNVTLSSIWSDLFQCSGIEMKPLIPLTLTKLRPCSCCLPNEHQGIFQTVSSCSYSQANAPISKACEMYKAPITVEKGTYNNPHCYKCDISFNNSNSTVHGRLEQDVCLFIDISNREITSEEISYASPPDIVVPVSIFFDLPTLDELFKNIWKRAPKASVKNCENKLQKIQKVYGFEAECEYRATIDELCDNGTSHGFLINAEIRREREIVGSASESVIASLALLYIAELIQVSPSKLQIVDNSFPSSILRNEDIGNTLVANKCEGVLNFTLWLDFNEYGRYYDNFISTRRISLPSTSDLNIQRLDIVRGCRGENSLPIDLCLGNLDDVKNTTNINLQNNSYVCLDEDCADIALVRNLKSTLQLQNTSHEESILSYTRQACVIRWCELHAVNVNSSFDDYTFVQSVIELIDTPLQSSITVSRWNHTHALVCSSGKNDDDVFQVQHQILTLVGCVISIVALLLTLITYARFPLLRRSTFVKLIMGLAATLLLGQLMLLFFLGVAAYNITSCTVLSVVAHYVWLCVFTFMLFIAVELHRTFGRRNSKSVRGEKPRVFFTYLFSALTFPLFIVLPCLILHFMKRTSLTYGDTARGCWIGGGTANLLAFVLPITFIIILNAVVFVATVYHLCTTQGDVFKNDTRKRRTESRRNLRISMKISTLMGFTWFFGFAATYIDYQALWYVFILLNTLQGLFIFISFMCNGIIWRLWTSQR